MTNQRPLVVSAEVGLFAVTLAAVLGMGRLFDGGGWAGPLVLNAAAAHVVVSLLRRRGLSLLTTGLLMVVAAAVVLTWTSYWSTTAAGLPTGDTWSAMQVDLERAWTVYQDVAAPAPVERGFVLASCLALWVVAYIADWASFRLWVPFEATLPASTLFLFTSLTSLLGSAQGRGWAVATYATAVLAFLLLHRLARQDGSSHWVADRRAAGTRSLLTAGAGLGVVAVFVGTVFGPSVPGAESRGVLDPRALKADDGRVVVSPLVDIRSRLIEQADVEVFTVQSPERAYWRLTSLETFDGRTWKSSGSFGRAGGELPQSVATEVDRTTFDQTYTIKALTAIWLPSAYEPRALRSPGVSVRYDEDSATLIVDNDVANSNGLGYRVTSAVPRIDAADVEGPRDEIPDEVRENFLDLPDGFSPRIRALAAEITAGAATPAEKARALQDHLRTFEYSLEVQKGHSENALEDFLLTNKVGYCEQFAGSFAAMARAIGLPARVAVGFTPGDEDPDTPGLYHVRGEYAHAWPEVYIAGAGWVPYEPTPGRGAPGAEGYTGVAEAQAEARNPAGTVTVPTTPTTAPTPGGGSTPTSNPFGTDGELDLGGGSFETGGGDDSGSLPARYLVDPVTRAAPFVGGAVLGYLVLFPLGVLGWRRRRRWRARSPRAQIELAWREAAEEGAVVGYQERPSDTFVERAHHLAAALPAAEDAAFTLATCLQAATYAAEEAGEDDADDARSASAEVAGALRAQASRWVRVVRWFDPRTLVGTWRRDHTARQRRITLTARGDLEQERELVGSGDRG